MIAVVAAVTMIGFNINHGTIKQVGASSVLLGTAIAFSVASSRLELIYRIV